MTTPDPHSLDTQLDALVAHYIEAIERGETPDREKLIAEYPALADGLRRFFADYDRLQHTNLQPAAHQENPEATFIPQHEPQPGTIFGCRYKLLQNIGEGGMGSVWVAEQKEPVKRKVAIKLVKAGMDSKQVLARFEAERQALAMMDHPNIAKVFDGGITEHGRPYFVMEYVKGVPFTEYCDKARLSLKERLNLFIPVCQAVQHAHHKGIVHRDLKPSNILICLYDGKPVPKVIDFGLAKAMHQQLTEQSIFTAHGVMVGTPLYMSPEQAEHNNLDVDTRTDIYSLGVVLYELLTGTTPLEREQLRTAAYNEVLRLIKEVEPPRPSTRLSGSDSLPSIAAQRSIDPRHLQKSVSGDLDWIVMKSLEKERSRRYETATGFARDIERFLNDEAVEACPPSRSYRLMKFVRKHRGATIATTAVTAALALGVVGTSFGLWRANAVQKDLRETINFAKSRMEEMWGKTLPESMYASEMQIKISPPDSPQIGFQFKRTDSIEGTHFQIIPIDGDDEMDWTRGMLWWMSNSAMESFDAMNEAKAGEAARADEAIHALDTAEGALARGFVRPLVGADVLTQPEIEALWELATLESETIGLRMLDEATRNPQMTEQLLNCAEPALVAAIGLNPELRDRALAILRPRLSDQSLALDHRAGIAWITLMLLDEPGSDCEICVTIIKGVMAAKTPSQTTAQSYPISHSNRVAALLETTVAESILTALAAPNSDNRIGIAKALTALSRRMERAASARISELATDLLLASFSEPEMNGFDMHERCETICKLSKRLDQEVATRVCQSASDRVLTSLDDPELSCYELRALAVAVAELSVCLDPVDAAQVCQSASDRVLVAIADPQLRSHSGSSRAGMESTLAEAVAALSKSLDPNDASRVCESVADRLLVALADPKKSDSDFYRLSEALGELSAFLLPEAAVRVGNGLFAVLTDSTRPVDEMHYLADAVAALSPRLHPDDAARIADGLLAILADPKRTTSDLNNLDEALIALSASLAPDAATRIANGLQTALADPKWDHYDRMRLAKAVVASSARLGPNAATRVCQSTAEVFIEAISNPNRKTEELPDLAEVLAKLSAHLEPAAAGRACDTASSELLAVLGGPHRATNEVPDLIQGLSKLSPYMTPKAAARVESSATAALLKTLNDPTCDYTTIEALARASIDLDARSTAQAMSRLIFHQEFLQDGDDSIEEHIELAAHCIRQFTPEIRRRILRDLFVLRVEDPFDPFMSGIDLPSYMLRETLSVIQQQEPHHATMAALSEGTEAATVSTENPFSTLKLTTPEIVEFLKSPLVQGDHRRAFLDLLECRYGRRFGNQWAFVEYAQAESLGLDFTTRAKRPDPKAILQNIRTLLDEEAVVQQK